MLFCKNNIVLLKIGGIMKNFKIKRTSLNKLILIILIFFIVSDFFGLIYAEENPNNFPYSDKHYGIGIIIGNPTGLNGMLRLSDKSFLEASVAWNIVDTSYLMITASYVFYSFSFSIESLNFPIYLGPYVAIIAGDVSGVGIGFEAGVSYFFEQIPLEIFIELIPGITILPETDFFINISIGVRYWL